MFRAIVAATILAITPALPAHADKDNGSRISITGTASITAKPDIAVVTAGVESVAKTAREALTANSNKMNAVFDAIRALGIEEKDVGTANFSINQNWRHGPEGSQPDGYRVSNQVTLRLRDVSRVGDVLDALTTAGVNQAGNIQFSVENADTLLDSARTEAVHKARARAELYAAAAGVELGRVLEISEGGMGGGVHPVFARMGAAAAMEAAPPIAPGEQDLSVSVTVTWTLRK